MKTLISDMKERLQIALARRFFIFFCLYVSPGFIVARHHMKMALALDRVRHGKLLRVMFAMPPRHGKSLMCSELFPAFWLGHHSTKNVIHASYASALSNSFSMKVRALVRDNERYRKVFPHMALDPGRKRIDDWRLVTGGGFKSIGVGGGVTGHGADLFIVDDPHKEGDEQSGTMLQSVFDWWTSAARTRLSPGAAVIFPMTRWHPRDLAGRLIELAEFDENADQWEVMSFPALALKDDALGREVGEALWLERFSRDDLLAIRAISDRYFEALFQQNPSVSSKPSFVIADFKRFSYNIPERFAKFWSVDLSSTENERSDYVVFCRWCMYGDDLSLVQGERFRAQWPEVKRRLKRTILEYPGERFYFPLHSLELLTLQNLRDELPEQRWRFVGVAQPGDKVERAGVLSDYAKSGRLYVVNDAFGDYFVKEHCGFPDELDHDDCVDASSVASHAVGLKDRFRLMVVSVGSRNVRKN